MAEIFLIQLYNKLYNQIKIKLYQISTNLNDLLLFDCSLDRPIQFFWSLMSFNSSSAFHKKSALHEPLSTQVIFHGSPKFYASFFEWLTGTKYRITNRGIEMSKGLCCKVVDNIEMFQIKGKQNIKL